MVATIRKPVEGGNGSAVYNVTGHRRSDGLLAGVALADGQANAEAQARAFAACLGRGTAENFPRAYYAPNLAISIAAMRAGHPSRGGVFDGLYDIYYSEAWPARRIEMAGEAVARAKASLDRLLAEPTRDDEMIEDRLFEIFEEFGEGTDVVCEVEAPSLVSYSGIQGDRAEALIVDLIQVGDAYREKRHDARRAYCAVAIEAQRLNRRERRAAGLPRFELYEQAEPVAARVEIEAPSPRIEAPTAPAAVVDDEAAELRMIARAVADIKASRGDLFATVRNVSRATTLISGAALADLMIAASRELTPFMHDAIRFSVDEARRAGADYDDGVVEDRVERRLNAVHAPITGQPGLVERNAREVVAAMSPSGTIGPTPFKWVDPDSLPPREWLYGTALIRREITATVAPGGGLKTSLGIAEALALASGKPLLGVAPTHRCKVWLWNGEEPMDEMQRRIMAACRHYGLGPEDIDGWLFVDTLDTSDFVIATEEAKGVRINEPRVAILTRWVRENAIDVLMIDPFISTHHVGENDNGAIQQVATAWKEIARGSNCAISLAHHIRKTNGQATTVDDSRGAKSLTDKARIVRPIALMTKEDAEKFGVPIEERRRYVSIDPTEIKGNMSLGVGGRDWYQSVSVTVGKGRKGNLDQGDSVGVVARWWPAERRVDLDEEQVVALGIEMGDKAWRAANNTMQRPDTIGAPICKAFGLAQASQRDRAKAWKIYLRLVEDGILSPVSVTEGYKSFPGVRFCNPST